MRPTNGTRVEATLDALSCLPNQAAATHVDSSARISRLVRMARATQRPGFMTCGRPVIPRGAAWQRTMEAYSDLPSMIVGLMSVNLATSARTSGIAGLARAAWTASDEANWK